MNLDYREFYENLELDGMASWMPAHIYALGLRGKEYVAQAATFRKNSKSKHIDDKQRAWLVEQADFLDAEVKIIEKIVAHLEAFEEKPTPKKRAKKR